jgi:hypothetical protein
VPWRVRAKSARTGPNQGLGLESGLYLLGPGEKELVIPGPFDPRDFNQVVPTLLVKLRSSLRVELRRRSGKHLRAELIPLPSLAHPQRVVAGFARNVLESEAFDELAITFAANAGPVYLVGVDLLDVPLESWEDESAGARPVEIMGETRRASRLAGGRSLDTQLQARPGARLDISYPLD